MGDILAGAGMKDLSGWSRRHYVSCKESAALEDGKSIRSAVLYVRLLL